MRRKLTMVQARNIRRRLAMGHSVYWLATYHKVSHDTIQNIRKNLTYKEAQIGKTNNARRR